MADQQLVDGPPAKRQKMGPGPGLGPGENADFNIGDLLDQLPDELGSLGTSPGGAQNGAKEPSLPPPDNTSVQRNQQLSRLLSSPSSTPSSVGVQNNRASPQTQIPGALSQAGHMGGLGSLSNLNNAVKSPLSNNLSSPPNAVGIKAPTSTPHSMNNDLMGISVAHSISSIGNLVTSNAVFSVANSLTSTPMTSQTVSTGSANLHPNQMMNGPLMGRPQKTAANMNV
jgi:hypothetical protein